MIVVTGAAGFIGSNLVEELGARGRLDVVAVDIANAPGMPHLQEAGCSEFIEKDALPAWLEKNQRSVEGIIHMGACSDTTQSDREFMMRVNFEYTRTLWNFCTRAGKRFVYASSAATYGDGSNGYDDQGDPGALRPLNLYGESKQRFDLWALEQRDTPRGWAGLKFFNVFGPREEHKGRMASVVYHSFNQIQQTGKVRLFESDRAGVPHGGQQRDFVYVADVAAAVLHMFETDAAKIGGLFNVGTGVARSFADLARAVFAALEREARIEYFPMPADLRGKYQYFTEAKIEKLRASGFTQPLHSLEAGVRDYVQTYLLPRSDASA